MIKDHAEPMTQWWFLKLGWIGAGCRYSGMTVSMYGFLTVVRYIIGHGVIAPLYGRTPMAFSAAVSFVIVGLSLFWIGWAIPYIGNRISRYHPETAQYHHKEMSLGEQIHVVIAIISSVVMILVSIFSFLT